MIDHIDPKRAKKIAGMRLLDDSLMKVVFAGNLEAAQLVIRTILEDDTLTVTNVNVETPMTSLFGRSVRLDISAVDEMGQWYDIEVQRSDKGAGQHRARFNSSLMDGGMVPPGTDIPDIKKYLKDSYIIFITESDPLGGNLPIYHIDRTVRETGNLFEDGSHIIYVNSSI